MNYMFIVQRSFQSTMVTFLGDIIILQAYNLKLGGGCCFAHMIDSHTFKGALVVQLEVVDGEEAAVRLVLDLDALQDGKVL